MKIGGFQVGDFAVKNEGNKRHLIFDCRNCVYHSNLAEDEHCRYHALAILQQVEAQLIVLAEVYERVYDEKQTKKLRQVADLVQKLENQGIWSYAHLGDSAAENELHFQERHDTLVKIAHDLPMFDPILSYLTLLKEIKAERMRIEQGSAAYKKSANIFLASLELVQKEFESTELIQESKSVFLKLKEIPNTKVIYHQFFEAQIKPSFIGSRLMFGSETEQLELLDEYTVLNSQVQIFKHPNKPENLYFVNPPEYSLAPDKYFVLSKTREIVAGYQPGKTSLSELAKSRKYFERIYESTIKDISQQYSIKLNLEEIMSLAGIVARYTVGYGILEILLSDRKLTDIYLDSPIGGRPIYAVHSDFDQCQTNIIYTESEAENVVSKLRAMSGRPFDESHPVLDFDLPGMDTRVAVIGKPLTPDGLAFAFRLHKVTPWTLPQFIDAKMMNPLAAGMLSFFIDNQATMLVTGSRGSGKTSLLTALMLEITQNTRIITSEDTMEIPVPYFKDIGFNIQRLKTQSAIAVSQTSSEVPPDQALRTALRLGDSALVIGEVRSKEAKVLYEAMRVGAAGNVVIGTIHGDSAYSVWDRVVNDLEVPTTSFKATDIICVARPIRFAGSLKRHRRLSQITEVKKHWNNDPAAENGLLDLMLYAAKKDDIELLEDNLKESDLFKRFSNSTGLTMVQMWDAIKLNASSKEFLVEMKNKFLIPELLEAENVILANNKLFILKEEQIAEFGKVNYNQVLGQWKNWVKENLVKKILARKKQK